MTQAMISYRNVSGQNTFAYALEQQLANAGIKTWIDKDVLKPGLIWEDVIYEGIINSEYVILCLSPEYLASPICLTECYIARGYGKKLLPIFVPFEGMGAWDYLDEKVMAIVDDLKKIETQYNFQYSKFALMKELMKHFVESEGIDALNLLDFNTPDVLGLPESHDAKIQRIVDTIQQPKPEDFAYTVYVSFKREDAEFATRITDDLNAKGYSTFISMRGLDVGVDWRRVHWSAMLRAKFHIVVLSPGIVNSDYVKNELRVTKTKKDRVLIPVLSEKVGKDETVRMAIRREKFLEDVNRIQWFNVDNGYDVFINDLVTFMGRS